MQQQLPNDVLWLELDDSILKAPRNGRVQYRVAEPGEVLGAGGRVLKIWSTLVMCVYDILFAN